MKYDHMIKINGAYYQTGQEVPENIAAAGKEDSLPFSDDNIEFETRENKKYTRTEILQMKTADLQELASKEGIDNAYDKNGSELKKILIGNFGL